MPLTLSAFLSDNDPHQDQLASVICSSVDKGQETGSALKYEPKYSSCFLFVESRGIENEC